LRAVSYRRAYAEDPALLGRVFELLDLAFPHDGLSARERAARALGCRWDALSTPFVRFEGERAVSHVGLLEIPLVLEGREQVVGGIHGVATHPERRRRGLYRSVMEQALAFADARYSTLVLTTEEPYLYEPFGFRVIDEARFAGPCAQPATPARTRLLDRGTSSDLALLHRLLESRAPVSLRYGVVRDRVVFGFDEAHSPLRYAGDLDALLLYEVRETTLRLYDVVAREIPGLAEIAARVPEELTDVEVYFAPDRLRADLAPEPARLDGAYFMARGPFPAAPGTFMVPRSARF
jgi:predicted N-acetyltransferase YhbS